MFWIFSIYTTKGCDSSADRCWASDHGVSQSFDLCFWYSLSKPFFFFLWHFGNWFCFSL